MKQKIRRVSDRNWTEKFWIPIWGYPAYVSRHLCDETKSDCCYVNVDFSYSPHYRVLLHKKPIDTYNAITHDNPEDCVKDIIMYHKKTIAELKTLDFNKWKNNGKKGDIKNDI